MPLTITLTEEESTSFSSLKRKAADQRITATQNLVSEVLELRVLLRTWTKNFPTSTQSLGLSRGVGQSHLDPSTQSPAMLICLSFHPTASQQPTMTTLCSLTEKLPTVPGYLYYIYNILSCTLRQLSLGLTHMYTAAVYISRTCTGAQIWRMHTNIADSCAPDPDNCAPGPDSCAPGPDNCAPVYMMA